MSDINLGAGPLGSRSLATEVVAMPCNDRAVCWAAIFAGAVGAAALSLVLVVLGSGLGFSVVSPWKFEGITAASLGVAAIAWLSFTQLAASGVGGYIAGRLRARWLAVNNDEVYFRDTAHGFLTWAVSALLTAVVITALVGSMGRGMSAGMGAHAAASLISGHERAGEEAHFMKYAIDAMFRPTSIEPQDPSAPRRMARTPALEMGRIFTHALHSGVLPQEDRIYMGGLVAQRTGLTQTQGELRVTQGFAQVQSMAKEAETMARQAADTARKVSAYTALWMTVALLIGAFVASLAAVYGGRVRDY